MPIELPSEADPATVYRGLTHFMDAPEVQAATCPCGNVWLYALRLGDTFAVRCHVCYRDQVPSAAKPPNAVACERYVTRIQRAHVQEQMAAAPRSAP